MYSVSGRFRHFVRAIKKSDPSSVTHTHTFPSQSLSRHESHPTPTCSFRSGDCLPAEQCTPEIANLRRLLRTCDQPEEEADKITTAIWESFDQRERKTIEVRLEY